MTKCIALQVTRRLQLLLVWGFTVKRQISVTLISVTSLVTVTCKVVYTRLILYSCTARKEKPRGAGGKTFLRSNVYIREATRGSNCSLQSSVLSWSTKHDSLELSRSSTFVAVEKCPKPHFRDWKGWPSSPQLRNHYKSPGEPDLCCISVNCTHKNTFSGKFVPLSSAAFTPKW